MLILMTLAGIFHLIFIGIEKGFIVNFRRIGAAFYIVVYFITLGHYLF